jgi:aspartyl-tRNA(Asn)/glutamyl-tRNA(Gln) amidotransferase subunit A
MSDTPWQGDACSLVDAFRSGERSPVEELDATLAAIGSSDGNAFVYLDAAAARASAQRADTSLPFGGVPIGIKALSPVVGWPNTHCSLAFAGETATQSETMVERLAAAGAVLVGHTNASEFGGLNISTNRIYGTTHNPWQHGKTAGGSSGGSAAAVAGGQVTIASGGDGGGSIRIPAAFNGLVGLKATFGRIPRGPHTEINPLTVVLGCLSRSVRDTARWFDVCAGYDGRDPNSLPATGDWEARLGSFELRGRKVALAPNLGNSVVADGVESAVRQLARVLIEEVGLELVEIPVALPKLGHEWSLTNLVQLHRELGDRWPGCAEDLTAEMRFGMEMAEQLIDVKLMAAAEQARMNANQAMAELFDQVDFVIGATNPDVAFPAEIGMNTLVDGQRVGPENNGTLTIPANICGNPAISIPAGLVNGLPVGMQVIGRHHEDQLLLDLAFAVERAQPWPLVATPAA